MTRRRFIKLSLLLFACIAAFLFVNRHAKFIDMSSINVETKDGLNKRKVVIKRGLWTINRESDEVLFLNPQNDGWVVFDGSPQNALNTDYGENDFLIVYDNMYYCQFRHFIFNNRHQHSYNLLLYRSRDTIYIKANIEGADERHFTMPMHLIKEASVRRNNNRPVNEEREQ